MGDKGTERLLWGILYLFAQGNVFAKRESVRNRSGSRPSSRCIASTARRRLTKMYREPADIQEPSVIARQLALTSKRNQHRGGGPLCQS